MSNTRNCFTDYIYAENLYGINRNFLLSNPRNKLISNTACLFILFSITTCLIYVILTTEYTDLGKNVLEFVLLVEYIFLIIIARFDGEYFDCVARMDEKCGGEDPYFRQLKFKVTKATTLSVVSFVFDVVGLYLLNVEPAEIIVLAVAFSAHDAEITFIALLAEALNMRLADLENMTINVGSKVYRHALITASHMNDGFGIRVCLMLGVNLVTTVVYAFVIILAGPVDNLLLFVYLAWREIKSFYTLWTLCVEVANADAVCQKLAFSLASRLVRDVNVKSSSYKAMHRWYSVAITTRPKYISSSLITLGLHVPLLLVDTSINYMLIIVQIYLAYK